MFKISKQFGQAPTQSLGADTIDWKTVFEADNYHPAGLINEALAINSTSLKQLYAIARKKLAAYAPFEKEVDALCHYLNNDSSLKNKEESLALFLNIFKHILITRLTPLTHATSPYLVEKEEIKPLYLALSVACVEIEVNTLKTAKVGDELTPSFLRAQLDTLKRLQRLSLDADASIFLPIQQSFKARFIAWINLCIEKLRILFKQKISFKTGDYEALADDFHTLLKELSVKVPPLSAQTTASDTTSTASEGSEELPAQPSKNTKTTPASTEKKPPVEDVNTSALPSLLSNWYKEGETNYAQSSYFFKEVFTSILVKLEMKAQALQSKQIPFIIEKLQKDFEKLQHQARFACKKVLVAPFDNQEAFLQNYLNAYKENCLRLRALSEGAYKIRVQYEKEARKSLTYLQEIGTLDTALLKLEQCIKEEQMAFFAIAEAFLNTPALTQEETSAEVKIPPHENPKTSLDDIDDEVTPSKPQQSPSNIPVEPLTHVYTLIKEANETLKLLHGPETEALYHIDWVEHTCYGSQDTEKMIAHEMNQRNTNIQCFKEYNMAKTFTLTDDIVSKTPDYVQKSRDLLLKVHADKKAKVPLIAQYCTQQLNELRARAERFQKAWELGQWAKLAVPDASQKPNTKETTDTPIPTGEAAPAPNEIVEYAIDFVNEPPNALTLSVLQIKKDYVRTNLIPGVDLNRETKESLFEHHLYPHETDDEATRMTYYSQRQLSQDLRRKTTFLNAEKKKKQEKNIELQEDTVRLQESIRQEEIKIAKRKKEKLEIILDVGNDRVLTLISQHFTTAVIDLISNDQNKELAFSVQLTALITTIENNFKVKVKDIDNMIKNHVLSAMLENPDYTSLKPLIEQTLQTTASQEAPKTQTVEPQGTSGAPNISGVKATMYGASSPVTLNASSTLANENDLPPIGFT
ncbi:MAG: hypothetical protein Q8R79_02740 [Legionellaceae bacterium]|nr:hypothetical protein [Legionellaceae bacterium]